MDDTEDLYQAVFSSSPDALILLHEDRVLALNPSAEARLDDERPLRAEITLARLSSEPALILVRVRDLSEVGRIDEVQRENEARFSAAAEGSLDAFFLLSAERNEADEIVDFVFTYANARALELFSRPRGSLLGERLRSCAQSLFERYARIFEQREPTEEEISVDQDPIDARWLHHQIIPLADGIAVTARDITTQKLLEAQLREAKLELEARTNELTRKNLLLEQGNLERARSEEELRRRQETILSLSAPIMKAGRHVLALPLIGPLDDARTAQLTERLLHAITKTRAHFTILDLTGVEKMDRPALEQLQRLIGAVRLLGSRCLVSGISPAIARDMTSQDASALAGFTAFARIEDALRHAID